MAQPLTKQKTSPRIYPRQRISSKDGFDSPLAQLAKQAAQNVSIVPVPGENLVNHLHQGLTFATPSLVAAEGLRGPGTAPIGQAQQDRPPLLINSFRDSFSTLSSRRSSAQTVMTLSSPEDGEVAFFSSGVSQRLSTADSVASQYSTDEYALEPNSLPVDKSLSGSDLPTHGATGTQLSTDPAQKKGFIRLTGARMARTLDNPEGEMMATPLPGQTFNVPSRTSTPLASSRQVDGLSTQLQATYIEPSPGAAGRSPATGGHSFWDSSRFQPGSSQIIPSMTLSNVSYAPVLRRDMSISRKSMVGEMGEYEYEDELAERLSTGSLSPRSSVRKGKSAEELGQTRPTLVNRNSRMHYTRRPAPPPPPVPSIPANFINNAGRGATSDVQRKQEVSPTATRPSLTTGNSSYSSPALSPRPVDARRPSHQLTPEERRARIAEDYLTKGITAHNDTTGAHDLVESAYYFRKAAEGGSSGGCVLYGESLLSWRSLRMLRHWYHPGLALRHG